MSSLEDRKGSPRRREGDRMLSRFDIGLTVACAVVFMIDGSWWTLVAALLNGNEIARGEYLGRPKT